MGNSPSTVEEQLDEPVTTKQTDVGDMVAPSKAPSTRGGKHQARKNDNVIRFAASSMQGWRPTNEDHHLLASSITIPLPTAQWGGDITLRDHSLFAVFDGHGGGFTSHYAGNNLVRVLTQRKEWPEYLELSERERDDVPGIELLKAALTGAFIDLDNELYRIHRGLFVSGASGGGDVSSKEARDEGEEASAKRSAPAGTYPAEVDITKDISGKARIDLVFVGLPADKLADTGQVLGDFGKDAATDNFALGHLLATGATVEVVEIHVGA